MASNSPVNDPFCDATSQPMTRTFVDFCWLKYATPSANPSMKMVTVGNWLPPNVPTTPVLE